MKRAGEKNAFAAAFFGVMMVGLVSSARADDEPTPPATTPPEDIGPPRPPSDAPLPPEPEPAPPSVVVEPEPRLVPARFGSPGVVVVTADSSLGLSSTSYGGTSNARSFYASISPGFDYFVVRNVSLGVNLEIARAYTRGYIPDGLDRLLEYESTIFALGPRVGWAIPLDERVTLYPRVGAGVEHDHASQVVLTGSYPSLPSSVVSIQNRYLPNTSAPENRTTGYLHVFVPVLFHPVPSFFVGFGPALYHGGAARTPDAGARTTLAARTVVGGHWGGAPRPAEPEATPHRSAREEKDRFRFGDAGDVVLTGDFSIGGAVTSNSRVPGSNGYIDVNPGVDVFFEHHVSVGISGTISTSTTSDRTAQGERTKRVSTGGGVAGAIGAEATLTQRLSLFPRAFFGFSYYDNVFSIGDTRQSVPRTALYFALSLPLVLHVAPHFFIGWGPYVSHDVSVWFDGKSSDANGTRVGASLLVGGWL